MIIFERWAESKGAPRWEEAIMSGNIYPVAPDWKQRAYIDQREIRGTLCLVDRRSRVLLGRAGTPHRLDQTLHTREKYVLRAGLRLNQMVRGRHHQCRAKLHRPASAPARKPHRDHLGRRRSEGIRNISPTRSCMTRFAVSPMSSKAMASRRATRSRSICR